MTLSQDPQSLISGLTDKINQYVKIMFDFNNLDKNSDLPKSQKIGNLRNLSKEELQKEIDFVKSIDIGVKFSNKKIEKEFNLTSNKDILGIING